MQAVKVELNMPRILNKVENDQFGMFLANEWHKLITPYTPRRDGILFENVSYKPFEFTYNTPYAHYMYNGVQYVDPVLGVSGFTNDDGATFFSRKGVEKIPSGKTFNYRTDRNPYATDHWDQAAENAGQKDKLIRSANEYLRRL